MKKLLTVGILVIGLVFLSNTNLHAQSFQKGDFVIDAGIGLGNTYSYGGIGTGLGLGIPFGAGAEYGIVDLETGSIGVGGSVGYSAGDVIDILYIGAKGSYHFNELLELEDEKIDLYGGVTLLYRNISWDYDGFGFSVPGDSGIVPGFHIGGRYYFADNIGGYAELGNNWAWLNLGVVFKL
ncbi:MAG: hypothetical protein U5K72_11640 [Balneolaceae bacterium]|nr:hypothetical protein [Balneolaceae bacterium]